MAGRKFSALAHWGTGLIAMGLSFLFIVIGWETDHAIFLASIFFLVICLADTLHSKIPNLANLALFLGGLGYQIYHHGTAGLEMSLLGAVTGFSLLILFHLMGGMGAGDVKALAALGALLGPGEIFQVFLYMALFGGVMSILHYVLAGKLKEKLQVGFHYLKSYVLTRDVKILKPPPSGETLKFPYAAAIAFGFFAYVHWGSIFLTFSH